MTTAVVYEWLVESRVRSECPRRLPAVAVVKRARQLERIRAQHLRHASARLDRFAQRIGQVRLITIRVRADFERFIAALHECRIAVSEFANTIRRGQS